MSIYFQKQIGFDTRPSPPKFGKNSILRFLASPGFVFYSPGHGDGADGFQSAVRPCQDEGQELRRRPVGRGGRLPVRHGQVSSYLGE